jgi:hypothetical protein
VNAPLVSLQSKNTNNEVRFKQLIRGAFRIESSTPTLLEDKFKLTPDINVPMVFRHLLKYRFCPFFLPNYENM